MLHATAKRLSKRTVALDFAGQKADVTPHPINVSWGLRERLKGRHLFKNSQMSKGGLDFYGYNTSNVVGVDS